MRPISDASITGFSAAAVASLFEGRIGLTRVDSGVIHVASGLSNPAGMIGEVCDEPCWCCAAYAAGIVIAAMKLVGRIAKSESLC